MNRHFLLFLLFFIVFISSKAQKNGFEAGPLLNINRCIFHGDAYMFLYNNKYHKMHIGCLRSSGGVFVKRYFSERVYGKMEMRYIEKGITLSYLKDANKSDVWQSLVLSYFELPFLIGCNTKSKKHHVLLETGFAYAKLIKIRTTETNYITTSYLESDFDTFRENDFSWVGEIDFSLNKKKRDNLFLGFRFSQSIFSINDKYRLRNSLYGAELSYLIKRKK